VKLHELKTWPSNYQAMVDGVKTWDWRRDDDRDFEVGDRITFFEFDPHEQRDTNRELQMVISYIMHGGQFGIPPGYCIMSIVEDK